MEYRYCTNLVAKNFRNEALMFTIYIIARGITKIKDVGDCLKFMFIDSWAVR